MKIFLIICIVAVVGFGYYMWKKEGGVNLVIGPIGSGSVEISGKNTAAEEPKTIQTILLSSSSGTNVEVWRNIINNEQEILEEAKRGSRVSDTIDKYDTLIPLYFTCKITATGSDDELRANIDTYIDLVTRKGEDPEYEVYMKFSRNEITKEILYSDIIRIYEDSITEFPLYADEARNTILVLKARLGGNYGSCTYTENGIQI